MSYTPFDPKRRVRVPEDRNRRRGPAKPKEPREPVPPLRKVIGYIEIEAGVVYEGPEPEIAGKMLYYTHELLECFHHQSQKQDIYGPTNAARRRCLQCFKEEKAHQALKAEQSAIQNALKEGG